MVQLYFITNPQIRNSTFIVSIIKQYATRDDDATVVAINHSQVRIRGVRSVRFVCRKVCVLGVSPVRVDV